MELYSAVKKNEIFRYMDIYIQSPKWGEPGPKDKYHTFFLICGSSLASLYLCV